MLLNFKSDKKFVLHQIDNNRFFKAKIEVAIPKRCF